MAIINSISGASSTLSNVLAEVTPVGGAIDVVASIFKAIGIRTATKHLSFDAVNPIAQQFQADTSNYLVKAFGNNSLAEAAQYVSKNFLDQMKAFWGLDISLNQTIATDVAACGKRGDTGRMLWLFCIWVGTNIDQERPETFQQFMRDLFTAIFLSAYTEAGYDITKLDPNYIAPAISVTQPYNGGSPGVAYSPGSAGTSPIVSTGVAQAGLGVAGVALLIGAAVYFFGMKGGR